LRRDGVGARLPRQVEHGQLVRLDRAQLASGGGDHDRVPSPQRDVSGGAVGQLARSYRSRGTHQFFAGSARRRSCCAPQCWSGSRARENKETSPKFPDLSSSASGSAPMVYTHGTPGATSAPTSTPRICSASTIAPDVSPPAETMRRNPRRARPVAISDMADSSSSADSAVPSCCCTWRSSGAGSEEYTNGVDPAGNPSIQSKPPSANFSALGVLSASNRKLGLPRDVKSAICSSVRAEQLPDNTAACTDPTGSATEASPSGRPRWLPCSRATAPASPAAPATNGSSITAAATTSRSDGSTASATK